MKQRERLDDTPIPNGPPNGRDRRGRFALGNSGGPGNPNAAKVGQLRARLYRLIRNEDIDLALETMREVMGDGKPSDRLAAAKLLLERAMGAPIPLDIIERLERLEATLENRQ